MKISCDWLKELTGLDCSAEEMAEMLTRIGLACDDIISTSRFMKNVVVGQILEISPVEGASKIQKTLVDVGSDKLQIICGAPNIKVGQKVPVAMIGAEMAGGLIIKKAKIRGVESYGMICSESELDLSSEHDGILVLDTNAKIGTDIATHLDYNDFILDLEITPNRGDALSAIGVARDLSALTGSTVKRPSLELSETKEKSSDCISVSIADTDACPRFTARIIRNIKFGESPWWMKKKLWAAGIRPISNVVDITNLIMLESGNPVHAFDLDKFGSNEVLVRRAKRDEKLKTLDGKVHTLTTDVLLITNGREPVAAAGVMGGFDSEVTESTTNILLEVAYFHPSVIRKGKRLLATDSEASYRFERGVDPNNLPNVSDRVAYLFSQLCGGEVLDGMIDCYPKPINPKKILLRPERCNTLLGFTIDDNRMRKIFQGLEFDVTADSNPIEVSVPTFRPDIDEETDLIEEIARIEGYDNIPDSVLNSGPLYTPLHFRDLFFDEIRRILTASGFDEMLGHGLAESKQAELVSPGLEQLKIINPVSSDLDIMRNSLTLSALPVVSHNIAHRQVDLRLFEIGKAYFPPNKSNEWIEEDRLLILVSGNTENIWRENIRPLDLYDIKGALEQLATNFGWPNLLLNNFDDNRMEKSISFSIVIDNIDAGITGQFSTSLLNKFEIKQPVWLAEISLSSLIDRGKSLATYRPLPIYPAAPRDIAVVVQDDVLAADLVTEVKKAATELAESITIFDVYKGKPINKGEKSIGISIVYRSPKRSLSGDEVDKLQKAVIKRITDKFKAEVREG